jgi:hypothetical protein
LGGEKERRPNVVEMRVPKLRLEREIVMLTPCNIQITSTVADIKQQFAIYTHSDAAGTIKYIGVAPLAELFTFSDAECNSLWPDHFSGNERPITINVIALTHDEQEAYKEHARLVMQYTPICNRQGYYVNPRRQNIKCVETGEVWRTAAEACKAHGLATSALTNHLNHKPGYKTVKGRTYIRTMPNYG